jgi:hypothetical protein
MSYWRHGGCITVNGDAYINLNEEVRDRSEDIIKLFTDDELKEEIQKREEGRSKFENRINKLYTYIYNVDVDVDSNDVLDEVDNEELIYEAKSRRLNIIDTIDAEKYELKKIICRTLNINEMYDDEEIFEMLREIWRTRR